MKNLKLFEEFINEGSFAELKSFMDELVKACEEENSDYKLENSKGILLDTVGGFGFRKETLVVNPVELGKEIKKDEKVAKALISKIYKMHKDKINKSYTRYGDYTFTFK